MAQRDSRLKIPVISMFMVLLMTLSGCLNLAADDNDDAEPIYLNPYLGEEVKECLDLQIYSHSMIVIR